MVHKFLVDLREVHLAEACPQKILGVPKKNFPFPYSAPEFPYMTSRMTSS